MHKQDVTGLQAVAVSSSDEVRGVVTDPVLVASVDRPVRS